MTTNQKGRVAEAKVIAKLVELGEHVLVPFGNSGRYDVALDRNGKLVRVEVKTGRFKDGCITFATESVSRIKKVKRRDYAPDADYFAVWCPYTPDAVFLVPVAGASKRSMRLRLDQPHKQANKKNIQWASDYVLD